MTATESGKRLRIVLINWQDRENPEAGGAEVHLHEVFGRLAARGHDVRAVVGGWPEGEPETTLDGIAVRRVGTRYTFPLVARRGVRDLLAERPADVVIEDINKIPLYSPLWAGAAVVGLVPHLFGSTAFREASWPVGAVVWGAERLIPRVYRRTPFQVISQGTAEDLVDRGIDPHHITVIPPGIDHSVFRPSSAQREPQPTLLYVGRLKRYKGLDIVLEALARLREAIPGVRLDIAGRGDDRGRLEGVVERLGLESKVRFLGYVSEQEKVSLLQRAWVAVYPSPKEGWGIANVEAAACGTPVVASDSPGLRESVESGVSGHLVPHQDVGAWVEALSSRLMDFREVETTRKGCIEHAARFSWDRAARETEDHITRVLAERAGTEIETNNR